MKYKAVFLFLVLFILVFITVSFAQMKGGKPFPSPTQKGAPTLLNSKGASSQFSGVQQGNISSKPAVPSDLSIERIYLRGCVVYITLANKGKGGLSFGDYQNGRLRILYQFTTETSAGVSPYNFSLRQVDPKGVLSKPQSRIDFNTGIKAQYPKFTIDARLERLKDDQGKGKKEARQSFSAPAACLQKPSPKGAFNQAQTSHLASGLSKSIEKSSKSGISRQGPSSQDLERARQLEMAEKMRRQQTLEEARGQREIEAELENRRRYQEREFEFSKDKRVNPKGGLMRGEGLWGSENPEFHDYRDIMDYMTRGSSMPSMPGNAPHQFEGGWPGGWPFGPLKAVQVALEVGSIFGNHYNCYSASACIGGYKRTGDLGYLAMAWFNLLISEASIGDEEGARYALRRMFDTLEEDLSKNNGEDVLFPPDDKELYEHPEDYADELTDKDPYVDPEKIFGSRSVPLPWAPHRKNPVTRKEESTDIERTPHVYDAYHGAYEKRKKESERGGGPQVNPGSTSNIGEIHHNNQGAETIWRMKTWATDPDFPTGAQEKIQDQQRMEQEVK